MAEAKSLEIRNGNFPPDFYIFDYRLEVKILIRIKLSRSNEKIIWVSVILMQNFFYDFNFSTSIFWIIQTKIKVLMIFISQQAFF